MDTFWRKALEPGLKLAITLRCLATGNSYKSLMYGFRVASNTISSIIPKVCEAPAPVSGGDTPVPYLIVSPCMRMKNLDQKSSGARSSIGRGRQTCSSQFEGSMHACFTYKETSVAFAA